jgi:hypothetical protein
MMLITIVLTLIMGLSESPRRSFVLVALLLILALAVYGTVGNDATDVLVVAKKLNDQSDLEAGGVFNSLDSSSIFGSLLAIGFGFGNIIRVPLLSSEVAFVKLLVGLGMVPFMILMFILFSPFYYVYLYSRRVAAARGASRSLPHTLPLAPSAASRANLRKLTLSAMPALSGALTLAHYGSLFRVTSIGLFCVMLATFYQDYLECLGDPRTVQAAST